MKTNSSNGNKFQNKGKTIFGKEDKKIINKLSRFSGFVQRNNSKITGFNLILGFMQMASKGLKTYQSWASEMAVLSGKSLSKQAIEERMNLKTENMLKLFVEEKLSSLLHSGNIEKTKALRGKFKSIMIDDSTIVNLPSELSAFFPGNISKGEKKSQAKIHALYNFTNNTFSFLKLHSFVQNDQSLSSNVFGHLQSGDLLLRDLGFQVLSVQQKLIEKSIYFISKKKFGTKVFDIITGDEINLLKELRKKGCFDKEVLVGKANKIKMRLVIMPLSKERSSHRKRKAKNDRDKRYNHSLAYYELLGYSILMTNILSENCSAKEIGELYGLRWRIETIFKAWKSHLSFEKIIPKNCKNIHRINCTLYLMLLYIILFQMVWMNSWQATLHHKKIDGHMSILKMAMFFAQHLTAILDPRRSKRLEMKLLKQCKYEKRNDRVNTMEKHEKLAA